MRKRWIVYLGIYASIFVAFVAYLIFSHQLLLWNSNSINVTAEAPLLSEKVKIEFGVSVNSINRVSDAELFNDRNKYTVLYDGMEMNKLKNEYGENDFLVTYDNKYYISFRQFKGNRKNQHEFNFHFYQSDSTIIIQVDIQGKDSQKFEMPMLEIQNANEYLCNVPIDSAK